MASKVKIVKNYRVIIRPDFQVKGKKRKKVYTAFCPTLGVADWGESVEEALEHIKEGIECYLESLVKHNEPIPEESFENEIIASCKVEFKVPKGFVFG